MSLLQFFSYCLFAYLLGSISWSYFIVKNITGSDLRTLSSGNLGATNAGRVLGRRWAVGIYLLDLGKGWLSASAPSFLFDELKWQGVPLPLVAALLTVVGHIFPFYLGFRGGKGVATGSGVLFALMPLTGLCGLGTWIVSMLLWRLVSLASVLAALSLPLWYYLLADGKDFIWYESFLVIVGLLVTIMHHSNIARILKGEER